MQSEFEVKLAEKARALIAMRELSRRYDVIKLDVLEAINALEWSAAALRAMNSDLQGRVRDNVLNDTLDDKLISKYNNEIIPKMKATMAKLDSMVGETMVDASHKLESRANPEVHSSDNTTNSHSQTTCVPSTDLAL